MPRNFSKTLAAVDFSRNLQPWDGFGVNYVQTAHTYDYGSDPQDYGGFGTLSEDQKHEILDLIFAEDGLKPGIIKMFLDPLHQKEGKTNGSALDAIDSSNYDHETSTDSMRYFAREGLKRTRARGADLKIITTLYGPPPWMTAQKANRGRDLDPKYKGELAKYITSWVKYLQEAEQLPIKFASIHNEGASAYRWNEEGFTTDSGHDYNMYWPPELLVDFVKLLRKTLDAQGLTQVGVTPGETTTMNRFTDWGYAHPLTADEEAARSVGLFTSHGFYGGKIGGWLGDFRSVGYDMLREKNPDLHAWVTSISWSKMDIESMMLYQSAIYSGKVNAIIPWACIQRHALWVGGDPNPGTAFLVSDEGGAYSIKRGYHLYKQLSRAGQPGMAVTPIAMDDWGLTLIGFSSNGTPNPDTFVLMNAKEEDKPLRVSISGTSATGFTAYRTLENEEEKHAPAGEYPVENGVLSYTAPPRSITTFYGK